MDNKDFKKELERTLALFKQLDFQQQLKENQQRLDTLAQKQEQLSKDTKDKKGSQDNLAKKQDQLNKDFEDVKKNLEDLDKKNSELEEPTEYKSPKEQSQQVQKNMKDASEQLSKPQTPKGALSKASQSQHSASQGMQKMSQQLASMEMNMEAQQDEANQASLRNILNNLVELSFEQEDLMGKVTGNHQNNLQYADIAHSQKELQDKASTIADSLYALSKRAPQMEGIVNQEMTKINYNMQEAIKFMEDRQASQTASRQQYSMTSINNLALMLNNVLAAMQAQSKNHSPGAGSCNKPGGMGSKPSMSDLQKMQESLSKQLDKMKNAMQKGQKPGQKQGGSKPDESNSEELAKMAAEQQYIREQMQQAEDEMNGKKQGGGEFRQYCTGHAQE